MSYIRSFDVDLLLICIGQETVPALKPQTIGGDFPM
jgi:hypothetical protein